MNTLLCEEKLRYAWIAQEWSLCPPALNNPAAAVRRTGRNPSEYGGPENPGICYKIWSRSGISERQMRQPEHETISRKHTYQKKLLYQQPSCRTPCSLLIPVCTEKDLFFSREPRYCSKPMCQPRRYRIYIRYAQVTPSNRGREEECTAPYQHLVNIVTSALPK